MYYCLYLSCCNHNISTIVPSSPLQLCDISNFLEKKLYSIYGMLKFNLIYLLLLPFLYSFLTLIFYNSASSFLYLLASTFQYLFTSSVFSLHFLLLLLFAFFLLSDFKGFQSMVFHSQLANMTDIIIKNPYKSC